MVAFPLAMSSGRMYYFKWSTYSLCGFDGFVLVGALIMFLAGLFFLGFFPKYGVDAGMAVRTILLYVVIYCMFTMSLRCCLYRCAETRLCMGP